MLKSVGKKSLLIGRHKSSSKDRGDELVGDDAIVWRWYLVEEVSPGWLLNVLVVQPFVNANSGSTKDLPRREIDIQSVETQSPHVTEKNWLNYLRDDATCDEEFSGKSRHAPQGGRAPQFEKHWIMEFSGSAFIPSTLLAAIVADNDTIIYQSSKNIVGADSDDENEKNNADPVPISSEMRSVMRSKRSFLDAHSNGEMNNKMDIEQYVENLMLKKTMQRKISDRFPKIQ
ncbi:hypothetical protein TNCV_2375491 [Trichonephila clavipes]|nr:hypothetical protein TNCV_2375491 [Trichonephila clavipes]